MCFPHPRDTLGVPKPPELIAAVLSGWATSWAATQLGVPGIPTVLLGLLVWATVTGRYRRRNPPPIPYA